MQTARDNAANIHALAPLPERRPSLSAALVRGITGWFCGVVDIMLLSSSLIFVALLMGGLRHSDSIVDFLAMRISVEHFLVLILAGIVWRWIFEYCDLYTGQHIRSIGGIAGRLAIATGLCAVLSAGVISELWHHSRFFIAASLLWPMTFCGACVVRGAVGAFHLSLKPRLRRARNVIIVGGGRRAEQVYQELLSHPEWRYHLLGFISTDRLSTAGAADRILGRVSDLEHVLMKYVVDEVVVVLPIRTQYSMVEEVIGICERMGVQVQCCADLFETSITKRIYSKEDDAIRKIVLKMVHDDRRHHVKRALDVTGASIGLLLLAPLFAVVAILIKSTSRGPVFFRQKRCGLNKRTFYIYKFRSMVVDAEAAQAQLEHLNQNSGPVFKIFADPRVTPIGKILRKTSIDELPQLFNVLKGEMSLVGPRPLNMRDVGRFSEAWLMRRFSVKPGLTCLWQISGRSNISFNRWIALDLHYIDHWSLLLDLKILAKTLPAVIKCRGAA
jgi:exopolysaccharide biosynthesis polyprenyl glycosylphosphotransferase